jgi:hypothetical protein
MFIVIMEENLTSIDERIGYKEAGANVLTIDDRSSLNALASTRKQQLVEAFRTQRHSLRVSASNIAAMTGFHPWKNLPELLLHDLVYQGVQGKDLLRHDAALLGLTLVAPDEVLRQLAQKAGVATGLAVHDALLVKQGITVLPTVQAATAVKEKAVQEAAKVLSKTELRILKEGVRSAVDTGYGTAHENEALDLYQQQTGWPVEERNAKVFVWQFGLRDDESVGPTVAPLRPASALIRPEKRVIVVNDDTEEEGEACTYSDARQDDATRNDALGEPFFSILGSVDGIREELAPNNATGAEFAGNDDDESWVLRKVIVECKHRMHRIQHTPPLYEQIQTTTYCLMYGVEDADIVQVLRTQQQTKLDTRKRHKPSNNDSQGTKQTSLDTLINDDGGTDQHNEERRNESNGTTDKDNETGPRGKVDSVKNETRKRAANQADRDSTVETDVATSNVTIAVSRISLDDPIMQHRQQWKSCILPRLRSFVEAVYRIRSDDDKRYRMLLAVSDVSADQAAAWKILVDECPWLETCDTAFYNARLQSLNAE